MRAKRTAFIVLLAILFLFFLQVLSDFIQSIYAFGLLVTALTPHLAGALLLFSPAALLFVHGVPGRRWLAGLAALAVLGRLLEPLLGPAGRLVVCAVSVGAFLLLFPLMIWASTRSASRAASGWEAAHALLLAAVASIFLRAAGSSLDISETGITQLLAWVLGVGALLLMWRIPGDAEPRKENSPRSMAEEPDLPAPAADSHEERRAASLRALAAGPQAAAPQPAALAVEDRTPSGARVIAMCIGMASVVAMLYFALATPTVIARWVGGAADPYATIVGVIMCAWLIAAVAVERLTLWRKLPRAVIIGWNAAFVVMLALTILPHQVVFPSAEEAYPLDPSTVSPVWQIALYAMLVLSPVIFVDFGVLVCALRRERATLQQLGGGFALASVFLLALVFLQVFTTIYDYTRPVGPLLRDRFWLVYFIIGLAMAGPMLVVRAGTFEAGEPQPLPRLAAWSAVAMGALAILAAIHPVLLFPSRPSGERLRVMTYNIQQGFDKVGNASLPAQLEAIRRVQPDVLGIEESDTARVANGNVDAVRYFANHLGMYSYYGPPTIVGTFGVALLSKYPIQRAWTFYLYSKGEQTACVEAVITANGKTYNVFVTHLGNGGPMVQLVDVLHRTLGLPNVILMGDFNFDPATPQYALTTQPLADAWLLHWPSGRQLSGGAEGRIDHIFVSPDMQVSEAEYVPDPASDHPYLYAVMK